MILRLRCPESGFSVKTEQFMLATRNYRQYNLNLHLEVLSVFVSDTLFRTLWPNYFLGSETSKTSAKNYTFKNMKKSIFHVQ